MQIENVIFVDRRRDDQQRPLVLGFALWVVLDELKDVVLENDLAGRGGQIDAHGEIAAIALAQLSVAQVAGQVQQSSDQAGPLSVHELLERIGVTHQEVAGCIGSNGLLQQIAQALARLLLVDWERIEQLQDKARIKQIKSGHGSEKGLTPVATGETSIIEAERLLGQ
ncbi:hypothetical protein D9M71_382570 [compost metagenome]